MNIALVELEWTSSPLWLLGCAALGLMAAAHLYWRSSAFTEAKPWQRTTMAILRGLTVATLAALLLAPVIKLIQSHTEKKQLVVLQDNSASLSAVTDSTDLTAFDSSIKSMLSSLDDKVETTHFYFDSKLSSEVEQPFSGNTTNLANAIDQAKEQFAADRLSAIVLATDGIYNEGQNPYYLKGIERIPLFIVALGDTTAGKDAEIQRVFHNKVVYKGDEFEVEVDISAQDLKGERGNLTLSTINRGNSNRIAQKAISIDKSDYFSTQTFRIEAKEAGVIRYRVALPTIPGEDNKANNFADFYVEVIESRQKIMLLAHAPHPDLRAIKTSLESLKNYEVDIQYARQASTNTRDYDLVVLHNLPSEDYPIKSVLDQLNQQKKSTLFIVGSRTNIPSFNEEQNIVNIKATPGQFADAEPVLSTTFNLFSIDNEIRNFTNSVPPLRVPFGTYSQSAGYNVLCNQSLKDIETNYPLIVLGEVDGYKQGVVSGEGIWKWRLFDYAENQTFERSDALLAKIFQYLAVAGDRRRFKVAQDKTLYNENDRIYLSAEFYNASYELKNEADVELTLINDENETTTFAFSRAADAYSLDLGKLAPGEYRYTAQIQDGGQRYTSTGRFSVRALIAELQQIRANHALLQNLANESNGKVYSPSQLDQLKNDLETSNLIKPLYISDATRSTFLNLNWLLAILIALLGLEWFMRKYLGSY